MKPITLTFDKKTTEEFIAFAGFVKGLVIDYKINKKPKKHRRLRAAFEVKIYSIKTRVDAFSFGAKWSYFLNVTNKKRGGFSIICDWFVEENIKKFRKDIC